MLSGIVMDEQVVREPAGTSAVAEPQNPTNIQKARATVRVDRGSNRMRARIVQIVSVVVLLLILIFLWRFLGDRSTPRAAGTGRGEVVPVELGVVSQKDVPVQLKAIGNVEPLSTIAVRSQVEGTLQRVGFVPGQEVKKGDVLFVIDPRPLQSALSQAEANLLKAMAAVRQGNLVRANDTTPMVTITQSAPIYVTFSVPEKDLMRIRQSPGSEGMVTQVVIPGDESNPVMGKLSLVDNTVDVATGTVRLKATFQNDDRRLYPGQFVNVVLTLGTLTQAIVVPAQAVQIGQDKSFVYVVKFDMTVEARTVKTGTTIDNMTVIEDGLKPGEQVVTDGQLRLIPGAKVQPKSGQGGGSPGAKGNQGGGNRNSGSQGNQGGGN